MGVWSDHGAYSIADSLIFSVPVTCSLGRYQAGQLDPGVPVVLFWGAFTPLLTEFRFGALVTWCGPFRRKTDWELGQSMEVNLFTQRTNKE